MEQSVGLPKPQRRDVVTAAVCWAVAALGLLILALVVGVDPGIAGNVPGVGSLPWWMTILVLAGQAVTLVWLRVAPRGVLLLVAALPLLVSGSGLGANFNLTSFAVVVASYVAFVERPLRLMGAAGIAAAFLTFAGYLVSAVRDGELAGGVVVAASIGQALLIVGGPAMLALLVTTRRDIRVARGHELLALAREARAQERTAMARELHDIAAHHLSGIAIMAAAIERQIVTDPASATVGIRQVRSQSTSVLRDLRRLVGLLREGDAAELDVETLDGISALTARASAGGAAVGLVILAADRELGGGVASDVSSLGAGLGPLAHLTAYRMVQESLANALRHAPGAPCKVTIDDRDPQFVVVRVHNDAGSTAPPTSRTGGGFGLVGMGERAALTAAELRYGPTIDGGWDVFLRLRRDAIGSEPR